jgi:hypothetical protein
MSCYLFPFQLSGLELVLQQLLVTRREIQKLTKVYAFTGGAELSIGTPDEGTPSVPYTR